MSWLVAALKAKLKQGLPCSCPGAIHYTLTECMCDKLITYAAPSNLYWPIQTIVRQSIACVLLVASTPKQCCIV